MGSWNRFRRRNPLRAAQTQRSTDNIKRNGRDVFMSVHVGMQKESFCRPVFVYASLFSAE